MASLYKHLRSKALRALTGSPFTFSYAADGFGVKNKFVPFRDDARFQKAWDEVQQLNRPYWPSGFPDIRWRAHTCLWAAQQCLRLPGDFAEFGVNTGIFAAMIYRLLPLAESGKRFLMFDTFSGIPESASRESEKKHSAKLNRVLYTQDVYDFTSSLFSPYAGAELVRGILPASLSQTRIDKLCYVSIDLNVAEPEIAVGEAIWDRIVPGGMIVLDDYGFGGHEAQNAA